MPQPAAPPRPPDPLADDRHPRQDDVPPAILRAVPEPLASDAAPDRHMDQLLPAAEHDPDRLADFREAARVAAELTFADFCAAPDSDFYQAPGRTPEQTWLEIRDRVGLAAARAVAFALDDATLTPEVVLDWHRRLFDTTFPADRAASAWSPPPLASSSPRTPPPRPAGRPKRGRCAGACAGPATSSTKPPPSSRRAKT